MIPSDYIELGNLLSAINELDSSGSSIVLCIKKASHKDKVEEIVTLEEEDAKLIISALVERLQNQIKEEYESR
jgi:hypothetical protein